eukprot:TRINITY_DN9629_c0_g1_i1.p1 TRINITY_DN9629_c0_g1~~TRINITY_DN9629_c0_g1_i1.p1  ORF type:complete len:211 (+),score=59.90 TRINITY_DN9629_c0_g1_i1:704-1336(+)
MEEAKKIVNSPFRRWMLKMLMKYMMQLLNHPIRTKMISGGVIASLSDISAQLLIPRLVSAPRNNNNAPAPGSLQSYNPFRTLKFFVYAATLNLGVHFWYKFLDFLFRGRSGRFFTVLRVLVDQIAFAPIINWYFLTFMSIADGNSPDVTANKVQRQLVPQLFQHWKVWFPAQFINFSFVPPMLRPLFGSFVALFWNTYLSVRNNRRVSKS